MPWSRESGTSTRLESSQTKRGSEYDPASQAHFKPSKSRSTFTQRKKQQPPLQLFTTRATRHSKLSKGGPLMRLTANYAGERRTHNP